jgi:hypothetical protein
MVIDLGRKITQKTEKRGRRGLKYDQKKKDNGQRPSGMEEDFIGNEGPQRTLALEEEEEGEMMKK